MQFDLETWGAGDKVVLVHWDSIHGDDIVIILRDGNAYLINKEDDTEIKVNLTRYLIELSKKQCPCEICMPYRRIGKMSKRELLSAIDSTVPVGGTWESGVAKTVYHVAGGKLLALGMGIDDIAELLYDLYYAAAMDFTKFSGG